MKRPRTPWPPRVGDRVRITARKLAATVRIVEGNGRAQLFILDVDGPATRIAYRLDELEPL